MQEPHTPAHHAAVKTYAKPVLLLALGQGPHGPTADLEFDNGWRRTLDLVTEADGWHPMFDALGWEARNKLRAHVRRPIEQRPDGSRFRREGLSFCTVTLNRRSAYFSACYFDVPAESYAAGAVTGYQAAAELLRALKLGYGPAVSRVAMILRDASEAGEEHAGKPSRRGAAAAFMEVMAEGIAFLGRHGKVGDWIDCKVREAEKVRDHFAAEDAVKGQLFAHRMQAAKRAKADRLKTQPAPSRAEVPPKLVASHHLKSQVAELEGATA